MREAQDVQDSSRVVGIALTWQSYLN